MEKLNLNSPDLVQKNIEAIAAAFPNVITEEKDAKGNLQRAVDFDLLRQELSAVLVEGDKERYQLTWPGKRQAILQANAPINKTLRPVKEDSVDWDTTQNIYIEGDNLEVLKLLQESYLNKVKCIYIDPPYNTGNDFVYKDDFRQGTTEYLQESGQVDEFGNRMIQNSESNGRFHSDWLTMMYPRLKLARNLLREDGVIFISIDDNEVANLAKICDEIFGKENFVDNIIWKKRYGGGAKEKFLVSLHEYVLVYCRNINELDEIFVPISQDSIDRYYIKQDEKYSVRGGYRTHPLEAGKAMDARENLIYPIPAPDGSQILPKKQWLWSKERAYEALNNNELEIERGKNGEWVVSTKQYLRDADGNVRQGKVFSIIDDIYTQHGTNEMISIFGNAKVFQYPKPSEFVKKLVTIACAKGDEIILDFFSGSASTSHAVMQLNSESGGKRKYIMVQLPEATSEESEAYKAGYKNICDIGKERIRRAAKMIKADLDFDLDYGFRVFRVDSDNMKDVYHSPQELHQDMFSELTDNIKADRSGEDLLIQVMLACGLPLSLPMQTKEIMGQPVHYVAENSLVACFAEEVPEELVRFIAKDKPLRVVFRDSSFASDAARINVEEIFKALSPATEIKVL